MPDQGIPLVKYFFHYVAFGVAFLWYETAKFEDKWSQINKLLTLVFTKSNQIKSNMFIVRSYTIHDATRHF